MWAVRDLDLLAQLVKTGSDSTLADLAMRAATPAPDTQQPGTSRVAVIPLTGIITPQGSIFDSLFGGAPGGLLGFRLAFAEALASPEITSIVIDVDSPGGLASMVPETAAFVRSARGSKPIVAVVDTQMSSAAYWIGSQADEIVMSPSGFAGSIGAYRVHEDYSVQNAAGGVTVTYVHAGEFKVEGNPNSPPDQAAREQWQAEVEYAYAAFVADVALGRGVDEQKVIDDFGKGRTLNARDALAAGLVDRIGTFDQVLGVLIGSSAASQVRVEAPTPAIVAADPATAKPAEPDPSAADEISAEDRALIAALLA